MANTKWRAGASAHKPTSKKHAPIPVAAVKQVPIRRILPEDLPLEYADGMMVQYKYYMFTLSFLQSQYPLVYTPEEIRAVKGSTYFIKSFHTPKVTTILAVQ